MPDLPLPKPTVPTTAPPPSSVPSAKVANSSAQTTILDKNSSDSALSDQKPPINTPPPSPSLTPITQASSSVKPDPSKISLPDLPKDLKDAGKSEDQSKELSSKSDHDLGEEASNSSTDLPMPNKPPMEKKVATTSGGSGAGTGMMDGATPPKPSSSQNMGSSGGSVFPPPSVQASNMVRPPFAQPPGSSPVSPPGSPPSPGLPSKTNAEMKPPAVVTALSSMASNKLPHLEEEKLPETQSSGSVRAQTPLIKPLGGSTTTPGTLQPQDSVGPEGKPPAGTPKSSPIPPAPAMAKPKKSLLKFLPLIIGGVIVLMLVLFGVSRLLGGSSNSAGSANPPAGGSTQPNSNTGGDQPNTGTGGSGQTSGEPVSLEYWGLWEPKEVMDPILKEFEDQNPGITVQYVSQSYKDYRERLQTAIASKTGPDVFRFHASWSPMLARELSPLPSSVLTTSDFESVFYPVARAQLTVNNSIVGVPVMYDGLVLYYNKDIFQNAGLQPPKTWSELRQDAITLTDTQDGQIRRAGVALGTSTNVEHFSDILALLMLQNGATLEDPSSAEARDALLFYTNFATKDRVWNDVMPSSTVAFARGDVAMMLAPSWRAFEIQSINPDLHFATATVPQLSDTRIAWASYWAEGVNALSDHQAESWKLIQFLSSSSVQKELYAAQAQVRSFGEPYARKDLADELGGQPLVAPLFQDAPYAQGWYMSSFTHDNGLNDQIIKYYADAVTAVGTGDDAQVALSTVTQGVQQVLSQYNLLSPSSQSAI